MNALKQLKLAKNGYIIMSVLFMILVGVSILFEGILNLCVAVYTVKIINNQKQDIIDMDEDRIR